MSFTGKAQDYAVRLRNTFTPRLDDEGKQVTDKKGHNVLDPVRFIFKQQVPVGVLTDFQAYWKKEALNLTTTLDGLLNQFEKQSKEGYKPAVRTAVLKAETRIRKANPTDNAKQILAKIAADAEVKKALAQMQTDVTANHIGATRSSDKPTKKQAAEVGIKLATLDPDSFRALAEKLGVELPN